MKRYLLFCGTTYYACGGTNDLEGDFDTVEECEARYEYLRAADPDRDVDWCQIADATLPAGRRVVKRTGRPHGDHCRRAGGGDAAL